MKRRRFSREKIQKILAEYCKGEGVPQLCAKYGITDRSFYRWKIKYGVQNFNKDC